MPLPQAAKIFIFYFVRTYRLCGYSVHCAALDLDHLGAAILSGVCVAQCEGCSSSCCMIEASSKDLARIAQLAPVLVLLCDAFWRCAHQRESSYGVRVANKVYTGERVLQSKPKH